jgi:hypothetical protein
MYVQYGARKETMRITASLGIRQPDSTLSVIKTVLEEEEIKRAVELYMEWSIGLNLEFNTIEKVEVEA